MIGDSAHVTPPVVVGDGGNCAMHDSLILSWMLKEFGFTQQAIARYEEGMFPCTSDVITRSALTGNDFLSGIAREALWR